jgi:multiple antibiotic resistance protein
MHDNLSGLSHLWALFLGTLVGILPIINPLAAAPTFLAITEGDTMDHRLDQARKACLYVALILTGALLGGSFVMNFFGISIPGLRLAGGIVVAGIGMRMVMPKLFEARRPDIDHKSALAKSDVSFSPMAIPLLSGPGSIGVTIGFASLASDALGYAAIILAILLTALICYLVLRLALRMNGLLGPNRLNALTQLMGFLLLCMGVQFIVNGLTTLLSDPKFAATLKAAYQAAAAP